MTTSSIARDALNGTATAAKITPGRSWQGAMNASSARPARSAGLDLNAAMAPRPATDVQATFREALNKVAGAKQGPPGAAESPEDAKLRKTAETLVNQLFMGTMLKSMRNSPFKDSTFSGGKAGDAYAGLFDQRMSEHAGGGMAGKLVDTLVKKLKSGKGSRAVDAYAANALNA